MGGVVETLPIELCSGEEGRGALQADVECVRSGALERRGGLYVLCVARDCVD